MRWKRIRVKLVFRSWRSLRMLLNLLQMFLLLLLQLMIEKGRTSITRRGKVGMILAGKLANEVVAVVWIRKVGRHLV